MAVQKLQVFLASRFEEFRDERAALAKRLNSVKTLPVEAIDLNDNTSNERPPLQVCYEAVERAEVFVLLIGHTYGDGVHKEDGESYTHLEYRRAIEDRAKIVLPWVKGSLEEVAARSDCDSRLRKWLLEIKKRHKAAPLNPSLTPEQNASTIFETVLERLWEIYSGGTGAPDDDEDASSAWDESPIRRDELRDYERVVADRAAPLRLMAANHVKEAWDALLLQLPRIAIKHLKTAVELVPLDVVPSYWLARLLIASGRRPECVQGRSVALDCARIAGRQRNELRQMVALILAARANERLEERTLAVEAAEAAHDVMSHHWMAKLELGRQYALSQHQGKAFKHANDAFWLRAETIRQIDRDPAYRALRAFESFRKGLDENVRERTEAVFNNELATIDFLRQFGEEIQPDEIWADWSNRDTASSLQRVRRARSAARHTLGLLQNCAKRLIAEAEAFKSHGFRCLKQATLENIQKERETERKKMDEAATRKEDAESKAATAMKRLRMLATVAGPTALILVAAAMMQRDRDWRIGLLFAAVLVVICAVALATNFVGPAYTDLRNRASTASDARNAAARKLAAHDAALADFGTAAANMRERLARFAKLVHAFEQCAATHIPISPVSTMSREKKAGDIVRVKAGAEQVRLETDLLDGHLLFLAKDAFAAQTDYWFARYIGPEGQPEVYSRRHAYFTG